MLAVITRLFPLWALLLSLSLRITHHPPLLLLGRESRHY